MYNAFVSMPFGKNPESLDNEWTKFYEYVLKPLENEIDIEDYEPIKIERADKNLEDLGLRNNVRAKIESCSFYIGVVTAIKIGKTKVLNPNVFWEMGYADALGKPIVLLIHREDPQSLPVLAQDIVVCPYDHNIVKKIIPSQAKEGLFFMSKYIAPYISLACKDYKNGRSRRNITRVTTFKNRKKLKLETMIANAVERIDILTTNLYYFLSEDFSSSSEQTHPFHSALRKGVSIRLVTMDPESVIAEYRAKQLKKPNGVPGYREELRKAIITLKTRFGGYSNFSLLLYNDLPLQITTRIDDDIVTSSVTYGTLARKRLHIKFNVHDEGVTDTFVSHFDSMLNKSTDVNNIAWILNSKSLFTDTYNKPKEDERRRGKGSYDNLGEEE